MKSGSAATVVFAIFSFVTPVSAADGFDARSIQAFLDNNFGANNGAMVVAVVDQQGTRVFSAGQLGDGTGRVADGATIFEIGSITKTFTALLLQDLVENGQARLDVPVSQYLPATVRMPTYRGTPITLRHLAEQTSGLPFASPDNASPADRRAENPFREYTVPKLYDFLDRFELAQEPGSAFLYSNVGMGLLGHAMTLITKQEYEPLVIERICRPLDMNDTRIIVSDAQQKRFAIGHDDHGLPAPNWDLGSVVGAGGLRSTANDLAKYVSAQLGLRGQPLSKIMQKTHDARHEGAPVQWGRTAMPWYDQNVQNPPGSRLIGHAGGTGGYVSFIGLDLMQHRGVVVLSSQVKIHSSAVGWRILQGAGLSGIAAEKLSPVHEIVGVGLALAMDPATHKVQVQGVTPGSPASDAKIEPGVFVKSIGGQPTVEKDLSGCVALLRGPAGTAVSIVLATGDGRDVREVELIRRRIVFVQ